MRAISLAFLVFFLAIAFGVLTHHLLTDSHPLLASISAAIGGMVCVGICVAVTNLLKRDPRWWPRLVSTGFHLLAALMFVSAVWSPDFSSAFRLTSASAAACLAVFGCLPLVSR